MPLLDHFHPPLSDTQFWESFHSLWIAAMVERLNGTILPQGYLAQAQVHIGGWFEVDVATFETASSGANGAAEGGVAVQTWAPPATTLVFPAAFPDELEVRVFSTRAGPTLVAAVELVSPGNKDRAEARRTLAAKCASYLAQGVGLIVVDIVTGRSANLHNELMTLIGQAGPFLFRADVSVYAAAYRPTRPPEGDRVELWPVPLVVGQPLPVLPLAPARGGRRPDGSGSDLHRGAAAESVVGPRHFPCPQGRHEPRTRGRLPPVRLRDADARRRPSSAARRPAFSRRGADPAAVRPP